MMPVMQLIVLPNAANFEMKNILVSIVDNDHSATSQKLINKIVSGNYFKLVSEPKTYKDAMNDIEHDRADLIIEIPQGFDRNLIRDNQATVMVSANAINGQTAGLAVTYTNSIIRDFNSDIRAEWIQNPRLNALPQIEITSLNWFNKMMNYKFYMVPGVLCILVTMVGFFMTALNVVREKEMGTIEQINVTPVKKWQFILSKVVPFWILGMVILTVGLLISYLIYGIVPEGHLIFIYLFAGVYLIAVLGGGLLASTFAETQQQAMFIAYFFLTLLILLGGIFASIDNMPDWAQMITYINPISYFVAVMRMVVLKGSGFMDILPHFGVIILFGIFFNSLAIWHYRKSS
jgi:ABC-2 type transport system permease protein